MSEYNPTTEEVMDRMPDDNRFAELVREMREDGDSWREIWERAEAAHGPLDRAAYKDSFFEVPKFEATVINWSEGATSGKRRDRIDVEATARDETPAEVADRLEMEHLSVENVEQTGTEWVA